VRFGGRKAMSGFAQNQSKKVLACRERFNEKYIKNAYARETIL
jgi:hypothetical protein